MKGITLKYTIKSALKINKVIKMAGGSTSGAGQSCDDVVDVVQLRQKENGPIIRPIIVEFRSEYDKWTVMTMKANLRECE